MITVAQFGLAYLTIGALFTLVVLLMSSKARAEMTVGDVLVSVLSWPVGLVLFVTGLVIGAVLLVLGWRKRR